MVSRRLYVRTMMPKFYTGWILLLSSLVLQVRFMRAFPKRRRLEKYLNVNGSKET